MKAVSFYHQESGVIADYKMHASDDRIVALNTPADHLPIEGHFDHLSQKVDPVTKTIIDHQPGKPSEQHEWSAAAKRWLLSDAAQANKDAAQGARQQIAHLERNAQPRALREHALGYDGAQARLKAIDDEISALRRHLG